MMAETTRAEVNELLDAFAKVSTLYVQQQLINFEIRQSAFNQSMTLKVAELERELNQTKESLALARRAYKEMAKKVGGTNGAT